MRNPTIRLRIALACAALVTVTGILVLVGMLYLTQNTIDRNSPQVTLNTRTDSPAVLRAQTFALSVQNQKLVEDTVDEVRTIGIIGLILLASGSLVASWFIAGRMLRPARNLAESVEQISALNLDRRLRSEGPDDELKAISDAFDRMLERLDDAFDRQRRFVADASHELKTPFATMRTQIDVALDNPNLSRDELGAVLQEVREVVDRGGELVDAMLALSRAETVVGRIRVDLAALAGEVITSTPGTGSLDLRLDLREAVVDADPVLLDRLVSNLVRNAVAYNRSGGLLEVKTGPQCGRSVLTVRNDGPRLPEEEMPLLFSRFHRGRAASGDGFGLGLPLTEVIARAHDGTITATARPEGGLTIRAELPLAGPDVQGEPQGPTP
ncbi:MAG: HAMP domain-containing histidine kinase [Solirubrobacterales bacterium]|nr:HAMP domain-containing histidine kinase [Solirubrobacterales bacterium]